MLGKGLDLLTELCQSLTIDLVINKESDPDDQLRAVCDALSRSFRQLADERDLLIQLNEDIRKEYSDRLAK